MAAVDPIVYAQLCKLFPKLTQLQVTDTCLYSAGATYKEIGELRGVSPETIKKSLEAARKRLEINNLQSLRLIFLSRVMLSFKSSVNHPLERHNPNPSSLVISELDHFVSLVPELSLTQAKCVFHFVRGLSVDLISSTLGAPVEQTTALMEAALSKLQVPSLNALRVFIFSKLLISLTLVSAPPLKR